MNRIRCYLLALGICLLSVAGLRAVVADPGGFPGIYEKDTPVLKQSGGREEGAEDAAEVLRRNTRRAEPRALQAEGSATSQARRGDRRRHSPPKRAGYTQWPLHAPLRSPCPRCALKAVRRSFRRPRRRFRLPHRPRRRPQSVQKMTAFPLPPLSFTSCAFFQFAQHMGIFFVFTRIHNDFHAEMLASERVLY